MTKNNLTQVADDQIYDCLNLDKPQSFFLFAGAGSGKTRCLVEVLRRFRENNIERLKRNGQKVAIITYTNAACDEIKRRLEFDSSFYVTTIHSCAWELISPYVNDIRDWLRVALEADITDLRNKQDKARSTNSKTYIDRQRKIESKEKRLDNLAAIKKFTYNPNGDNTSRDSLNHAEVINIAAYFIQNKPLMQSILVRKFPILLIDESQDTKKELIDAFFKVQSKHSSNFVLGMFGDTMQRIYTDGKVDLGENIPENWAKPRKEKNHRCPKRVIELTNKIREDADGQEQVAGKEAEGVVRLFIVDTNKTIDKSSIESQAANQMIEMTGDHLWCSNHGDFKILTLEHHMAAKRGGFLEFFDPLYKVDKLKTGLLDGSLSGITLFAGQILSLVNANKENNKFEIARIVKKNSPLLKKDRLKDSHHSIEKVENANNFVNSLLKLWSQDNDPTLADILEEIYKNTLFQVPDALIPIADRLIKKDVLDEEDEPERDRVIDAWEEALKCPFSQFEKYVRYISDKSRFGTHQGIKGLEFPRVMVILDDEDARGFLFSVPFGDG